ncbi:type II toxin-antitoxin system VapC family toxin [Anaerolineales bacterium HSG25]|nr:type II toxin-antitoxin system VapC family toxin [Anaerolineales bacterium HSG25]
MTKTQVDKLSLRQPIMEIVAEHVSDNNVQILPITLPHTLALQKLPLYHRDPFDRMLIAQADVEGATLLSKDSRFIEYDIDVVW